MKQEKKKLWVVKGLWNSPAWKGTLTVGRYTKESAARKALEEAQKKPYFIELRIIEDEAR